MHKWRQYYLLKQKIRNEDDGITLVELLAAISILSIVILLAGSVHMFGQKQFIEQTKSASQTNDLSYAMTVMSKDLRQQKKELVDVSEGGNKILVGDHSLYTIEQNQLKKGEEVLATNISEQAFTKEGDKIVIKLETITGVRPKKTYETTIYFRR